MRMGLAPPTPQKKWSVFNYMTQQLLPWLKSERVDAGQGIAVSQTHNGKIISSRKPFTVTRAGGLNVRMEPGVVIGYNSYENYQSEGAGWRPMVISVKAYEFGGDERDTLTMVNGTNYIWSENYFERFDSPASNGVVKWILHSDPGTYNDKPYIINQGTSFPLESNQFDPMNIQEGNQVSPVPQCIPIAKVTATGGEITEIIQYNDSPIPLFFDISWHSFYETLGEGDIVYGFDNSGTTIPATLQLGLEGDYLSAGTSVPSWTSPITLEVVTDVRDNAGTIEKQTREIEVFSYGTASPWTPV